MRTAFCRVTLTVLVLAGYPALASDQETSREIGLSLRQPKSPFVLGQPVWLTVVFQNNLKRDVRIKGFCPEDGHEITTHVVHKLTTKGCITEKRTERPTTQVLVTRLSGTPAEGNRSLELKGGRSRSFLLKAGASEQQSFDLMQTFAGALPIDSPGRYKVSLVYKMETETTEGYDRDALDWEGEARASPIEISVVAAKE